MNYLTDALRSARTSATATQTQRANPREVQNNAGGFVYQIDDFTRLRRWLILGSEGGTYHQNEAELTKENADAVLRCLATDGIRTVNEIVAVSKAGNAPNNELAIFALALASAHGDEGTRMAAHDAIPMVCRTGTHLFQFTNFVDGMRSWGGGLKRGVSRWYEGKDPDQLAYQVIKYRQREDWTHRDVLRSAHPSAPTPEHATIYDFVCGRGDGDESNVIAAFQEAQRSESPEQTASLIRQYGNVLPREALKTEHTSSPVVWDALLAAGMPVMATVRNLGNMSKAGILDPGSIGENTVLSLLGNDEAITYSRIHPVNILVAAKTYALGRGLRGDGVWTVNPKIIDAMDAAFYKAFDNVEPSGKRRLIAIDNSASMRWENSLTIPAGRGRRQAIPGFVAADAAAAIALISLSTGDPVTVAAFSAGRRSTNVAEGIRPLALSAGSRIIDVQHAMKAAPSGGTDCSLPMLWAEQLGREFDSFEVYTDNDTWAGVKHPDQALRDYRENFVSDAKLVVFAMTPTRFSIADPQDSGMLDVVGFDTSAPAVVSDFIAGRI